MCAEGWLRIDDSSLRIENPSLRIEDRSLRIEDRSLRIEDRSLRIEDRSLRIEDRSLRIEDRSPRIEDRSLRIEDPSLHIEDLSVRSQAPFDVQPWMVRCTSTIVCCASSIRDSVPGDGVRRTLRPASATSRRSLVQPFPQLLAHVHPLGLAGAGDGFECFAAASFTQQVEDSGGDDALEEAFAVDVGREHFLG
jgi:hypothetical protein